MNYGLLSKHRGALMGFAMLIIVLFHVNVARQDAFFGLHRLGNLGVDIFLFLSGIGLWFSWTKHPEVWRFYRRRLIRIYPAWLIIALIYFVPRLWQQPLLLAGEVLFNVRFWTNDEGVFWFIPAILAMYLLAPHYMRLIQRRPLWRWLPVLLCCWCVAVQWVQPIHEAVGHIEIFWSRLPIFFIGINCGALVMEKRKLPAGGLSFLLSTFGITFALCLYLEQAKHGTFPLFIERMAYIPLTLSTTLLLAALFVFVEKRQQWLLRGLNFIGGISLEIYLIHAEFILKPLQAYGLGYWPTALLTIIATLPLAWLLHKLVSAITQHPSPITK